MENKRMNRNMGTSNIKQVICITGGSSGFGFEIAKKLATLGHTVYAGARHVDKMIPLKQYGVHTRLLNVTQDESVKTFVNDIINNEGRIDVLINNAGYGAYGIHETQSLQSIQAMYDVNVFGVIRMNQAILPIMRKQQQGRIIHVASLVSNISLPGVSHYAATKHALRAMTEALRMEVKPLNIKVIQIEPGAVNTGFEEVALGLIEDSEKDYQSFLSAFKTFIRKSYKNATSLNSTVKVIVKASLARRPKWVYRTTLDAKIYPVAKTLLGLKAYSLLSFSLINRNKQKDVQTKQKETLK